MDNHLEAVTAFKATIVAIVGTLTALWGWLGWLVIGWVGLMALDYISGSAAAARLGEWTSKAARDGIWHKIGMVVVVTLAAGGDMLMSLVLSNLPVVALPIEYKGLICPLVLVWYCLTEMGSVAENAVKMGAGVPPWLVKLLAAGKDAVNKAGDGAIPDKKE